MNASNNYAIQYHSSLFIPIDTNLPGVPNTPLIQIAIQSIESTLINPVKTIEFPNNNKYMGKILNGIPHGPGEMNYACGVRYVGQFANGMRHGQGIIYLLDGSRYEGSFSNDQKSGTGIMYYADGRRYVGEFSNDFRHGQGTMYSNNGYQFTGRYENDVPNGKGICKYENGTKCEGFFVNNQLSEGILTLENQKQFRYPSHTDITGEWDEVDNKQAIQ